MSTEIQSPDGTLTVDHASGEVLLESVTSHGQTSHWLTTEQALELAAAIVGAVLNAQRSGGDGPNEGEPWKRWSKDSPKQTFPCPHCGGEVARIERGSDGEYSSRALDGIQCCSGIKLEMNDRERIRPCPNCGDIRGYCSPDRCVSADNE